MKILTEFVYPPIPDRSNDWCAYLDEYEPGSLPYCLMGWGETKEKAIAELRMLLEDWESQQ